jgi:perosamine synthetase
MSKIPVYQPQLDGNVSTYVNECLSSGWISSRGGFISKFEEAFARFVGAEAATTVANGTVAIHLALEALGIGPGDEVIVPSFTYIASVNTIIQSGATPVFVDSLADTLQVDPILIEKAITPRTRAVMVVHLYGHPCDMDAIVQTCRDRSLYLIEDCAEAFGTRWRGQHVGTFGDAATFSFFGNKTITTGEGGMVLARDPAVMEKCRRLKSQGVSLAREYWHDMLGFNYRMTNIQAAIGLAQLEQADEFLALKTQLAETYIKRFAHLPVRSHTPVGKVTHSYWMCSLLVEDSGIRDDLRTYLGGSGIETRPFFAMAHHMPHCHTDQVLSVGENLSKRGMNLPSYPGLTSEQIDRVCESVCRYFERAA